MIKNYYSTIYPAIKCQNKDQYSSRFVKVTRFGLDLLPLIWTQMPNTFLF
jgi:hypothetical protein